MVSGSQGFERCGVMRVGDFSGGGFGCYGWGELGGLSSTALTAGPLGHRSPSFSF